MKDIAYDMKMKVMNMSWQQQDQRKLFNDCKSGAQHLKYATSPPALGANIESVSAHDVIRGVRRGEVHQLVLVARR